MFIRRIMNHTHIHVNQFGNSAYLISTLLPEARLTGCEIARPDADLTEPTIALAPLLRRYLARVRPPMRSSPTAPEDSSTTDASRPSVGVLSSDSPSEEFYASKEEAEDAYDLAKDYHTTFVILKFKTLFNACDKQVERQRIQDTNLLTLIMLYLTRASIDRLEFGFAAQYAGVGTSGMALVKLLLISHRPLPRVLDHVVIIMYDKLKSRRQDGKQMEVHVNHFRVGVQELLDMGQNPSRERLGERLRHFSRSECDRPVQHPNGPQHHLPHSGVCHEDSARD